MAKKITTYNKAKIFHPKNIVPIGETNIITDNVTKLDGCVKNQSPINADMARKWVDENHM